MLALFFALLFVVVGTVIAAYVTNRLGLTQAPAKSDTSGKI